MRSCKSLNSLLIHSLVAQIEEIASQQRSELWFYSSTSDDSLAHYVDDVEGKSYKYEADPCKCSLLPRSTKSDDSLAYTVEIGAVSRVTYLNTYFKMLKSSLCEINTAI